MKNGEGSFHAVMIKLSPNDQIVAIAQFCQDQVSQIHLSFRLSWIKILVVQHNNPLLLVFWRQLVSCSTTRYLFIVKGVACETILICCRKENIKDTCVYRH